MEKYNLVLGGSSDIGVEIVSKFIREGENVLYTYNLNNTMFDTFQEMSLKFSCRVISKKMDIESDSDISDLFSFVISEKIKLHSLIYNIGKNKDSLFHNMAYPDFEGVINVNLLGCFKICKGLINSIASNEGSVVLISSVSGMTGMKGQINYSSSKAGLIAFGRGLASEYAKMGVRVNSIAPGFIKTKMLDSIPESKLNQILNQIPMRRLGEPSDVANMAYFLISEESRYITGQTFVVDGGALNEVIK